MSTPSKKYADPSELSDHLERNEHGNLEPDQQSEHEGARSPYAPKPAHLRSTMPPSALGLDVSGGSAYAPRRARSGPSPEAHADTYEPAGEPDREEGSLEEASPETASEHAASLCPDTPAVTQPAADPFEPETAVSLQPGQARDGARDDRRAPQRNDERRDTRIDDRDLARLEESVRWMQQRRQAAAMRLPRATGLPPLNPPLSDPIRGGAHRAEQTSRWTPRSLEPTHLAPPPPNADRHPNLWLAVGAACILVGGVLYMLTLIGSSPSSQTTEVGSSSEVAELAPLPQKSPLRAQAKAHVSDVAHLDQPAPPLQAQAEDEPLPAPPPQAQPQLPAQAAQTQPQPATASAAPPQSFAMLRQEAVAPAPQAPPPRPAPTVRPLDPEEISLLIKQGEKFIATGDVVTARTMFRRAADAGDATGALALGATYDPTVLARLGVMGMGADLEKARAWYRTAESLGSAEAKHRLQLLSQR